MGAAVPEARVLCCKQKLASKCVRTEEILFHLWALDANSKFRHNLKKKKLKISKMTHLLGELIAHDN